MDWRMRNQYGHNLPTGILPGGPAYQTDRARWDRPNQPPLLGLCSASMSYFFELQITHTHKVINPIPVELGKPANKACVIR